MIVRVLDVVISSLSFSLYLLLLLLSLYIYRMFCSVRWLQVLRAKRCSLRLCLDFFRYRWNLWQFIRSEGIGRQGGSQTLRIVSETNLNFNGVRDFEQHAFESSH